MALPLPAAAVTPTQGSDGSSFSESRGCATGSAGTRTPIAPYVGYLASTVRMYGPWADFFGRSYTQVRDSQVWVDVPGSSGGIKIHQRTLPAFQRAVANLEAAGNTYTVGSAVGWVWRTVGGKRRVSQHAFGNAFDVNPYANPYRADNVLVTDMPPSFRQAWIDAGYCWGGQWVDIKDTMHYSWMGPRATPGYGGRLAPYPPLTAAAPYTTVGMSTATPFAGGRTALADAKGDGADDLFTVEEHDGTWRVEAAGAVMGYAVPGIRWDSAAVAGSTDYPVIADFDGDSRPDLWLFDTSADPVTVTIYDGASRLEDVLATLTTGLTWQPGTELAVGYYDWADWIPDLYAIRTGAVTSLEVFDGASSFATRVLDVTTGLADTTGATVLLGDYDVDGNQDLYAVPLTASPTVRIALGADGYTAPPVTVAAGFDATGATVLLGDYDGDGRDDIYLAGSKSLTVYLGGVPDRSIDQLGGWFTPPDPVYFDAGPSCDGPGLCDQIGYVDPGGEWHIGEYPGYDTDTLDFYYGNPGDIPFMGDWDGDGVETPGLYRQSDGYVYLRNSNTQGTADISFYFGNPGDVPVVGDFDGDGYDTVSIYRPAEGRFYIINRLGDGDHGLGTADYSFLFGDPGDQPFVGDLDGDGIDEVGLHRATTGRVYFRYTLTQGVADVDFVFGNPGDVLFAGDWNGDGTDTVAVYRPGDDVWYIKGANRSGAADHAVHVHGDDDATKLPVAGKANVAVP